MFFAFLQAVLECINQLLRIHLVRIKFKSPFSYIVSRREKEMLDEAPPLFAFCIGVEFCNSYSRVLIAPVGKYTVDEISHIGSVLWFKDNGVCVDSIGSVVSVSEDMFRSHITLMHFPSEKFKDGRFLHRYDGEISPNIFSLFRVIENTAHIGVLFPPIVSD